MTITGIKTFAQRHIGPNESEIAHMLEVLGYRSLDQLTAAVVPTSIADNTPVDVAPAASEEQALAELAELAAQNKLVKSLIGQGYYDTHTPKVIQRNVLENPAWYTAYTPYQPEISQGRLEVLFYFQTLITELTGMDIANASLLDEGSAAGEAMTLAHRALKGKRRQCLVSERCHPQTLDILTTRATPLGIELVKIDETSATAGDAINDQTFAVIVQYPDTYGSINELTSLADQAHQAGALVIVATDLLALTMLTPPAEFGADIVIGNSQRFGVPLGFGGPHAGFFATKDQYKRSLPGRLVGQSVDAAGSPAFRLALQTREQHIRREKATSNICTAQALLAIMAALYACYHGPRGLRALATHTHQLANALATGCRELGFKTNAVLFDTVTLYQVDANALSSAALEYGYNLNVRDDLTVSIAIDETCEEHHITELLKCFGASNESADSLALECGLSENHQRHDNFMSQAVFHQYHSETEMMRYLRRLAEKDIALDRSMIPLGSCTMKLNAASEMAPVSWPEFARIHPFAPADQTLGYQTMIAQLEDMLCACTGYDAVSLQPNAGSQGEYAGLLAIKAYHEARGEPERDICLIPSSAHGTNPASAHMANMHVVVVNCDEQGNIDLADLDLKIAANPKRIAAIMITYPSTHGVFEEDVTKVCQAVHNAGGQVYIDGANLNALVGVAAPGKFGGDVSHLNLHKTFCIPHGGGGPGVGPVAVRKHLTPYLPNDGHNADRNGATISAAPFGSAGILPISWMYIRMMGAEGLRHATQVAILSANYVAQQLSSNYAILFTGAENLVAHECIIDTRAMKANGVTVDDIAKRLIDYGFHAPTMSFPVPNTLMIEPTESESLAELDRFCFAMNSIFDEYQLVKNGSVDRDNNLLRNAPHTLEFLLDDQLDVPYSRRQACLPSETKQKYWPPVGRIDNVYGDRNLLCSCPSMDEYQ